MDAKGNTSEFDANVGFSNTGNTLCQPSGDFGLYTLSEAYSLSWYGIDKDDPLEISYDTLKLYDTSSIPEEDFIIDNSEDVIKDMASQPYEILYDIDGEVVRDINYEIIYVLKTF